MNQENDTRPIYHTRVLEMSPSYAKFIKFIIKNKERLSSDSDVANVLFHIHESLLLERDRIERNFKEVIVETDAEYQVLRSLN